MCSDVCVCVHVVLFRNMYGRTRLQYIFDCLFGLFVVGSTSCLMLFDCDHIC